MLCLADEPLRYTYLVYMIRNMCSYTAGIQFRIHELHGGVALWPRVRAREMAFGAAGGPGANRPTPGITPQTRTGPSQSA